MCGFYMARWLEKPWKVQPFVAGVNSRLLILSSTVRLIYAGQPPNASESIARKPSLPMRFMMLLHISMLRQSIEVESGMQGGHILCDNDPNFPADPKPQCRLSLPLSFRPQTMACLGRPSKQ